MRPNSLSTQEIENLFSFLAKEKIQSYRYLSRSESKLEDSLWLLPEITLKYYSANNQSLYQQSNAVDTYHEIKASLQKKVLTLLDEYHINQQHKHHFTQRLKDAPECLTFRYWQPDDAATYYNFLSDKNLWTYLPDAYPSDFDIETARDIITHANQNESHQYLQAIQISGKVVGQIRLLFNNDENKSQAEISYWIANKYQGQGFAKTALPYFILQAFQKFSHLEKIYGIVAIPNKASSKALIEAGFHKESLIYKTRYTQEGAHPALKYALYRSLYVAHTNAQQLNQVH